MASITDFFTSIGLTNWEQWSYFAVLLTLFVNTGFFIALILQIRQGRITLKESRRSTEAAESSVREARRARIDEQAPRVIAILEKPSIHGISSAGSFTVSANPEYTMPAMKDDKLFLIAEGSLVNEGKGTARVRLNGNGAVFVDDEDFTFVTEIQTSSEERILRPGEGVRFAWSDGHSLEDWVDAYQNPYPPNPRGACFMEVIVRDYIEDGVIDNLYLEMAGRPLKPVEGDAGRWVYNTEDEVASVSYPARRRYRLEADFAPLKLPWEDSYSQWKAEHENTFTQEIIQVSKLRRFMNTVKNYLAGE